MLHFRKTLDYIYINFAAVTQTDNCLFVRINLAVGCSGIQPSDYPCF